MLIERRDSLSDNIHEVGCKMAKDAVWRWGVTDKKDSASIFSVAQILFIEIKPTSSAYSFSSLQGDEMVYIQKNYFSLFKTYNLSAIVEVWKEAKMHLATPWISHAV